MADGESVRSNAGLGVIRVTYRNDLLGSGVFWEGPADRIGDCRNIPARMLAEHVAANGGKKSSGMWTAELLAPRRERP